MSSAVEQAAATRAPDAPVFNESVGGALIDAARISIMGAMELLPPAPMILLPGEDEIRSVQDCLEEAMNWLNAARVRTIELAEEAPTSTHIIGAGR